MNDKAKEGNETKGAENKGPVKNSTKSWEKK